MCSIDNTVSRKVKTAYVARREVSDVHHGDPRVTEYLYLAMEIDVEGTQPVAVRPPKRQQSLRSSLAGHPWDLPGFENDHCRQFWVSHARLAVRAEATATT